MDCIIYLRTHCSGSAAAARLYIDAIAKLANQAQQSSWNGSSDVGKTLEIKSPLITHTFIPISRQIIPQSRLPIL
jgi:hypothetical protein